MRNIANHNIHRNNPGKKIYNLKVEKLVREANDNFIYYRDYEMALMQVDEVLQTEPDHTKALILKGNILFCKDNDIEALEYFNKAINVDPKCAEAYGSKAGTLDILGRQREALVCCDKAFENITLNDRNLLPALFDQKIAILVRIKKYEQAREVLKNCLKTLSEEDGGYLISCYQELIDMCCKEKRRKREMVAKMSLKVIC